MLATKDLGAKDGGPLEGKVAGRTLSEQVLMQRVVVGIMESAIAENCHRTQRICRITDTHFPMGGTYFQAASILAQLIDDIDHACCSMLFAEFCTF